MFPVVMYRTVSDTRWRSGQLRIAVLADLHVCTPWLAPELVQRIVKAANALKPDLILLAGDYLADRRLPFSKGLTAEEIAPLLLDLDAPLGVYAIMGNHDYKDCPLHRSAGERRSSVAEALAGSPVKLLRNEAVQVRCNGKPFWLVGLDSQRALGKHVPGFDDAERAFSRVPENATAILLAHEPDYFANGDPRALLQISGHTHGGQLNLFGWRPLTPSRYGGRYAVGQFEEAGRHLVVSAGIGYSGLPMRLGAPPEITLIEMRGSDVSEDGSND